MQRESRNQARKQHDVVASRPAPPSDQLPSCHASRVTRDVAAGCLLGGANLRIGGRARKEMPRLDLR